MDSDSETRLSILIHTEWQDFKNTDEERVTVVIISGSVFTAAFVLLLISAYYRKSSRQFISDWKESWTKLELKPGDLVEMQTQVLFTHWGFYVGGGNILHFQNEGKAMNSPCPECYVNGTVTLDTLRKAEMYTQIRINNMPYLHWKPLPNLEQKVQEYILQHEDEGQNYNLVVNNCEHFASSLRFGEGKGISTQIGNIILGLLVLLIFLIGYLLYHFGVFDKYGIDAGEIFYTNETGTIVLLVYLVLIPRIVLLLVLLFRHFTSQGDTIKGRWACGWIIGICSLVTTFPCNCVDWCDIFWAVVLSLVSYWFPVAIMLFFPFAFMTATRSFNKVRGHFGICCYPCSYWTGTVHKHRIQEFELIERSNELE